MTGTHDLSKSMMQDIRNPAFRVDPKHSATRRECRSTPLTTLDELVPPGATVMFWHLDVEGAERTRFSERTAAVCCARH